jgi:hypothetical protein
MERQKHIWLILSITVTLVTLLSLVIHLWPPLTRWSQK